MRRNVVDENCTKITPWLIDGCLSLYCVSRYSLRQPAVGPASGDRGCPTAKCAALVTWYAQLVIMMSEDPDDRLCPKL